MYQIWGGAALVVSRGCGYGIPMMMMEAAGNGGGGRVEGFGGGEQGDINGRQWDGHQQDIVLACLYYLPHFPSLT